MTVAALAACSSTTAAPAASTTSSTVPATTAVASTTTTTLPASTTSTSSTTTTVAPTTTIVSPDLSYADIPIGTCDTITDGAIGYRNETGNLANAYERIGNSSQGRTIWAEHWGSVDGPQVLVIGQEHGDECAPAWFVRAIREQPPTAFGIWLVPTANPDGLAAHTRRTAQDVDPNRDGFRLATPEAQAVMYATSRYQPVLSIHVHSPYQWIGSHNGGPSHLHHRTP
jgi:protein MpaA